MKNFIYILISISFLGCASFDGRHLSSRNQTEISTRLQTECVDQESATTHDSLRSPANGVMCSTIFTQDLRKEIPSVTKTYAEQVTSDFARRSQLFNMKKRLQNDGQLESPVPISKRAQAFREETLPLMKLDPATAEGVVRSMELDLRSRSYRLKKNLEEAKTVEFEHVVVGAGVHGILATAAILEKNPNAKILIVDSTDTPGATFRATSDLYRINSSSRPSGPDTRPLPGEGNLNELPGLPIQVSDLSANKYPTSGDLGRALVAGAYASVISHPNVRMLLTTDITKIDRNETGLLEYSLSAKFNDSGKDMVNIQTSSVIMASGLGLPTYIQGFVPFLKANPKFTEMPKAPNKLPRVITFEDLFRLMATSDNPKKYFEDLKIDVIGSGDSANVLLEFLLGYAPEAAYGFSSGQVRGPQEIRWIGQSARTCKEFIAAARSRYAQIGTGFRSSSAGKPALLKGIKDKAKNLKLNSKDQLEMELTTGQVISNSDLIIVATGFEGQLHKIFSSNLTTKAPDDSVFLAGLPFIEEATSVSANPTRVGKILRGRREGSSVVFVGPGAGPLAVQAELVGIIQNFVSIFNNAPRTVAAMDPQYVQPSAGVSLASFQKADDAVINLPMRSQQSNYIFEVTGVDNSRTLTSAMPQYIQASLKTFFQNVSIGVNNRGYEPNGEIAFKMISLPDLKTVSIEALDPFYNIEPIVRNMAASRDFFGQVADMLNPYEAQQAMVVRIPFKNFELDPNQMKIEYVDNFRNGQGSALSATKIPNGKVEFRGIKPDNQNSILNIAKDLNNPAYEVAPFDAIQIKENGDGTVVILGAISNFKVSETKILYRSGTLAGYSPGEFVYVSVPGKPRLKVLIVGIRKAGTFFVRDNNRNFFDVTPDQVSPAPQG